MGKWLIPPPLSFKLNLMLKIRFSNFRITPIKRAIKAKLQKLPELNQFQLKELSKMWFNAALLCLGSLILKFFEPGMKEGFDGKSWIVLGSGVGAFILLVIAALLVGSKVKKDRDYG